MQMDYYNVTNFLQFSVGTLPVTEVLKGEDDGF